MQKEAFYMALLKVAQLTPEELQQLSAELESRARLSGPEATAAVVPGGPVRQQVQDALAGTPQQRTDAQKGALRGAAISAGLGAATKGVLGGLAEAPKGLFMAVPGAVAGYQNAAITSKRDAVRDALSPLKAV
jgi:hypothetical protein